MEKLEQRDNSRYVEGGLQLIGELLKGTFVAGLKDDRIKYIVKTKGEEESLAQLIETALQEESEVRSVRFRGNQTGPFYPTRGAISNEYRGPQIKREVNVTMSTSRCYRCNEEGHMSRNCNKIPHCSKCNKKGHQARDCRQGNLRERCLDSRKHLSY